MIETLLEGFLYLIIGISFGAVAYAFVLVYNLIKFEVSNNLGDDDV